MNFTFQGNYPAETGMSTLLKIKSARWTIVFSKRIFLILQLIAFLQFTSGNCANAATPPQAGGFKGDTSVKMLLPANYQVDTLIARHNSKDMIIVIVRQEPSLLVRIFNFLNLVSLIINNLSPFIKRRPKNGDDTKGGL